MAADKVATETAATSSSAYEEVAGHRGICCPREDPRRGDQETLGAAPGSLPGAWGQDQTSANELMRRAQFLKALEKEAPCWAPPLQR